MKNQKLFLMSFFFVMVIILSVHVSAARLPTVGGDNDAWGTVLNTYLNVSLNESGELRNNTVSSLQIVNDTITDADISDTTNLTLGEKLTFTLGEVIDNIVNGWITITGSLNITQSLNVVGNITFEGKLNVSENIGASGNVTSTYFFGNGSQLTSLTESQIDDLVHTINGTNINVLDVNASSATIHGDLNVTGTSYLGDITIASDNLTTNGIVSKDGNITFYNNSGSEQVRITQEGRLGIGTTKPSVDLEVVGDIVSKGTFWTSRTSASDRSWGGVTYGNGLFVAFEHLGAGSRVMTSPDGIIWSNRTSTTQKCCREITYVNGQFVGVGSNGAITSTDGIVWTNQTPSADLQWNGIAYGNGTFVAVNNLGTNGITMYSYDGKVWTNGTAANENNWAKVTYGNGLFVAVSDIAVGGSATERVMTSSDGITWTERTTPNQPWNGVTYGNGLFVAVASSGTNNRVMTSPDGITWTSRTSAADNDWREVTYGDGLFVAVAESGTDNRVMTSPDGINWVTRTSAADNDWESIVYGNGVFVAVADTGTGNRVMTSGKSEFNEIPHDNTYFGKIELRGNLNVTGTSYLGEITIASDNLTTNGIVSKDGNITFYNSSGSEHIRITRDGRLGIGVGNPSEKMNVSGNVGASGNVTSTYFFGNGSQLTSLTESQIDDLVHTINDTNINVLDVNASSATIHGDLNVTGTSYLGDITITSDNLTTNGIVSKDGNITFYNNSGSEQVRITQYGRLGIGVNNPSEKLNVSGNIGASGNVTSTYFFGNGSQLTSLTESQIDDLVHTINGTNINVLDVNASSATINGDLNVTGVSYLGDTGIGATSVPSGPLHVVVPDNAIGLYIENSGGTTDKSEFSFFGDSQSLAIGAYNDADTFVRTLIDFDHDGGITLPNLGSVTDVRHVCATAAGVLELKDGACSGSSRRFKENEKSLNYGIDELMLLQPKFFNYKTHSNLTDDLDYLGSRTKRRIGMMAEDVFEVLPEVVVLEDGIIDSIDYSNLIPLTIKAIQEQQVQIDALATERNLSVSVPAQPKKLETIETVSFNTNAFGQAIISAKDTEIQINFETTYENIPIITLTPLEFIDGQYKLSEKTTHGFRIVLQKMQSQDIAFDWHAFSTAGGIISTISEDMVKIVTSQNETKDVTDEITHSTNENFTN
jgi:hypothetical protein